MNEIEASSAAGALGGYEWQSGGGIWLVRLDRDDGSIVLISDDAVCEYQDDDAMQAGRSRSAILLSTQLTDS